jgi:hypothetical protein
MPSTISAGTTAGTAIAVAGDTTGNLAFQTNGTTTAMTITTAQNVGIGTTSPANKLELYNGDQTLSRDTGGGGGSNIVNFRHTQNTTAAAQIQATYTGDFRARLLFNINTSQSNISPVEVARFENNGNFSFNSGYGSSAVAYGCRAWVNFNGTGTPAIRASGNVTSITDNGTGDYTINFTTAMPDANYSIVGMTGAQSGVSLNIGMTLSTDLAVPTTSAARVQTRRRDTNSDVDVAYALVSVFR